MDLAKHEKALSLLESYERKNEAKVSFIFSWHFHPPITRPSSPSLSYLKYFFARFNGLGWTSHKGVG